MALLLSMVSNLIRAEHVIEMVEAINFVAVQSNNEECSFSLPPTATLQDLARHIESKCAFQYAFEIQVRRETVFPFASSNQIIAKNPNIAKTWRMLAELWEPDLNFRIPLKVLRIPSTEDIATYQSMLEMFAGLDSKVRAFGWYHFIDQCARSEPCFVQTLCDRFNDLFKCTDGKLKEIRLNHQRLSGIIDLSALPSTVTFLTVERNSVTDIGGLDQLVGKQLRKLMVRKNPLEIDLKPLGRFPDSTVSEVNPLLIIWVTPGQIIQSLQEITGFEGPQQETKGERTTYKRVREAAQEWINASTLNCMMLGLDDRRWEICRQDIQMTLGTLNCYMNNFEFCSRC